MIVFKRRLIIWLIRAYIKKWGKVIILSFLLGLGIFFILFSTSRFLIKLIPLQNKTTIGIAGVYTSDNIPSFILVKIAKGLTSIDSEGHIRPALAKSWEIKDKGHTYVFHLDENESFTDGQRVGAKDINYDFADVKIERPEIDTVVFHLKDVYAPFLVTVSRPILKKNNVGAGDYRLEDFSTNGNLISSLTLILRTNKLVSLHYIFYSTPDIVKTAFLLGEVNQILEMPNTYFDSKDLSRYPNVQTKKFTQYNRLVTLFYNTQDEVLSDNKVRSALSYVIRDDFTEGERAYLPYPPQTWYFNRILPDKKQDIAHAKLLLQASNGTVKSLSIKTLSKYMQTAKEVSSDFAQVGIKTNIEQVDYIPSKFQIYLGDFNIPKDPDQYTLWHYQQENNITLLNDKRIDKFLEDGRQTISEDDRKEIYDDFQKFLSDRAPATFLYFPYEYTITRK